MLHVAVGIIVNAQQEVLVAKRAQHKHQGGLWEFPGGKVEKNESAREALSRELKEELNIEVISAYPLLKKEYHYSDRHILLDTWMVLEFSGEPDGIEGQLIQWILPDKLRLADIPEANHSIIQKVREILTSP